MELKEFERLLCDSLTDIQSGIAPTEFVKKVHFINTLERENNFEERSGVRIVLNNGEVFDLLISGHKSVSSK